MAVGTATSAMPAALQLTPVTMSGAAAALSSQCYFIKFAHDRGSQAGIDAGLSRLSPQLNQLQ